MSVQITACVKATVNKSTRLLVCGHAPMRIYANFRRGTIIVQCVPDVVYTLPLETKPSII